MVNQKLEIVKNTLKESGLKLTKPRLAILKVLTNEHRPFTVEEIHDRLVDVVCDLVTVYRNISNFEAHKIVKQCHFGDGVARYEFIAENEHHHHHIICKKCQKFEDFDYCFVKELERMVAEKGYSDITHSLEFYGICQNCS